MKVKYVMKFVADMDKAVALHPAPPGYPPGSIRLAFSSPHLDGFYAARDANGVKFTMPPTPLHGSTIARFLDSEGARPAWAVDPPVTGSRGSLAPPASDTRGV